MSTLPDNVIRLADIRTRPSREQHPSFDQALRAVALGIVTTMGADERQLGDWLVVTIDKIAGTIQLRSQSSETTVPYWEKRH